MRKILTKSAKFARIVAQRFRLIGLRWRLGVDVAPGGVAIGPRARVTATNGGRLRIGNRTTIDADAVIQAKFGSLEIGQDCFIGQGSVIVAREDVIVGRHALVAEYVTIRDQDHDFGGPLPTSEGGFSTAPIRIGNNVWLGAKVTVLKGVTIGDNAVVGANSVVTADIPPNVVAVGAPARVIRQVGVPSRRKRSVEC